MWIGIEDASPKQFKAYHSEMSKLNPEGSNSGSSHRSLPADILLREDPEEEDEDEEEHDDGGENEDQDEGYSE